MRYIIGILLVAVLVRLLLFYLFPLQLKPGQIVQFQATLLQDPKIIGNSQEFMVRYGDFWHSTQLLVQTPADMQYAYGQTLRLSGTIRSKLLKNNQTILAIQNPQIEAENSGILPVIGTLRGKIIDFCENNFSQPYSGLLVGIIFGAKTAVTAQTTTSFRITGLSHLLVVDGLKITLIAGFLVNLYGLFFQRRVVALLSILSIGLYVALSGFEISAVRAGVMAILVFGAQLFGRQYSGFYVLGILSAVFLLVDPLLLTAIAFQLSVLATAGILLLKPALSKENILSDGIALTLAAQLATLPILVYAFGSYSLISIPIHILVMWTIPFIMTVGAAGVTLGLILAPLGKLVIATIIPLLWFLDRTAQFFSTRAGQVQISSLPIAFFVGYYLLLASIILSVYQRKRTS